MDSIKTSTNHTCANGKNTSSAASSRLQVLLNHLHQSNSHNNSLNSSNMSSSIEYEHCTSSNGVSSSLPSNTSHYVPLKNPEEYQGFRVRYLRRDDYKHGYLKLLSQLTSVGDISEHAFKERFDTMQQCEPTYQIIVIEHVETEEIIGAATLLIELKFIHSISKVGHIEDVVVDKKYRGRRLGVLLMDNLKSVARHQGCYKIILDCAPDNESFYNKAGFYKKEIQMRYDL